MDVPCQKGKVDAGQTTSDDPKNPAKARNIGLHPEEVPHLSEDAHACRLYRKCCQLQEVELSPSAL